PRHQRLAHAADWGTNNIERPRPAAIEFGKTRRLDHRLYVTRCNCHDAPPPLRDTDLHAPDLRTILNLDRFGPTRHAHPPMRRDAVPPSIETPGAPDPQLQQSKPKQEWYGLTNGTANKRTILEGRAAYSGAVLKAGLQTGDSPIRRSTNPA